MKSELSHQLMQIIECKYDYSMAKERWASFVEKAKTKKVVLFGTNDFCLEVRRQVASLGIKIDLLCDYSQDKWYQCLEGLSVVPPNDLVSMAKEIVVVIADPGADNNIFKHMHEIGVEDIYHFGFLLGYQYVPKWKKMNLSLNDVIDIEELNDLLEDEKSKKILLNLLYYRITFDYQYILEIVDSSFEQYFDTDIVSLTDQEIFIDAGAYTGDTLEAFVKLTKRQFKKIYCYEPDDVNFAKLKDMATELKVQDRVSLIKKGVHYQNDVFSFCANGSGSSHISESGNSQIEVCTIADTIKDIPTYIKMDIEGSEIEALYGIKDIIKKYKPKLAICVYHKSDDLWRIPLILKRWVPEYHFYLRHYFPNQYETVCYAVIT